MLGAASLADKWSHVHPPDSESPVATLRRIKRLALVVMLSFVALGVAILDPIALAGDRRLALLLLIAVVACWIIVGDVTSHVRAESVNRIANARAARLQGARLTATAMQDRIANKLSLTVGYCEFLANDPRIPEDLRQQAQKALLGARAAADTVSELKRLTKDTTQQTLPFLEVASLPLSDGPLQAEQ